MGGVREDLLGSWLRMGPHFADALGEQILGYPAKYVTCSTDAERDLAARLLSYARGYHTPAETSAG